MHSCAVVLVLLSTVVYSQAGIVWSEEESFETENDGPFVTDDGPQEQDDGPLVTDHGPQEQDDGPFVTDDGPQEQDDGPFVTDDGPQEQDDRPQVQDNAALTFPSAVDTQIDKEDRIAQLTARIGDLEGAVQTLQVKSESAMRVSDNIAFHAVSDKGEISHLGINQHIPFGTVLLNIGNAYHVNHGVFIAPTAGLYMFSASLLSFNGPKTSLFNAGIVKNGEVLAGLWGNGVGGNHAQGSATVVTQLKKQDKVCVRLTCCADDSLSGLRYTTFTGALIA